jgi:uncharacterized protein
MKFVIFHGAFGSASGNWYPELKSKLEYLGQTVFAPQFPEEDEKELTLKGPNTKIEKITLQNWLTEFEKIVNQIDKNEKVCFIGHSLGCVFILQAVAKYKIRLDSAIFVSPFLDCLPKEVWPYDSIITDFVRPDYLTADLTRLIPDSYVLYSDNDPYVTIVQSKRFAEVLGSSVIKLHKAGHMNAEVDLDEFALVLDLCLTRLDLSYANKYRFLSRKIGAFEHIYLNDEAGVMTLDAQSTTKEGLFNFDDVKKIGFATQFTGFVDGYGVHSPYMEQSRRAAGRMDRFDRVILVEKIDDLNNPMWTEQIMADIKSGINIYVCLFNDVKDTVPEPDFGIWDNHHVVIGRFDRKTRKAKKYIVDSTPQTVTAALKWQKEIMNHSVGVKNVTKDIRKFLTRHKD